MKFLLDVNLLFSAIWTENSRYAPASAWLDGKQIVLCPLTELGFIRISVNTKVLGAPMSRTRELLARFIRERSADRIADDLAALDSLNARTAEDVTDHYLADLAAKHGLMLATFDERIKHPSVELVR